MSFMSRMNPRNLLGNKAKPRELEHRSATEAGITYDSLLKDMNDIPNLGEGSNTNLHPLDRLLALGGYISSFTDPREKRNLELTFDRNAIRLFENNFASANAGPPKIAGRKDW